MGTRFTIGFVAAILVAGICPAAGIAQSKYEVLDQGGRVTGLFEYTYVVREEGHFASSQFFKGAKAVKSTKGMKPVLRSHVMMDAGLVFDKYTRWETRGIDTTTYKVFKFKKELKMRVARGEGGKVSVLGKVQPVFVLEPDQPHLALLLADPSRAEYGVACVNTKLDKVGKATVKFLGEDGSGREKAEPAVESAATVEKTADATATGAGDASVKQPSPDAGAAPDASIARDAAEPTPPKVFHYTIEGDCGRFQVWIDELGEMVKASSDTQSYRLIP